MGETWRNMESEREDCGSEEMCSKETMR